MSKFFINRPIVAMVISILMVLAGVVAALSLPTAQFPKIAPPEIQARISKTVWMSIGFRPGPLRVERAQHRTRVCMLR